MRFDIELWKERRNRNKVEQESLVDLLLYPFGLIYDLLDCWRMKNGKKQR